MKTSKLRVTSLCAGNSPVTGEFPAQMASNVENLSIWWRQHVLCNTLYVYSGKNRGDSSTDNAPVRHHYWPFDELADTGSRQHYLILV